MKNHLQFRENIEYFKNKKLSCEAMRTLKQYFKIP